MISVFVNKEEQQIKENTNILILLAANEITQFKGVAVAVNHNVIHKSDWKKHLLKQGDKVTIISATAGG